MMSSITRRLNKLRALASHPATPAAEAEAARARIAALRETYPAAGPRVVDWHATCQPGEPPCGSLQWRTKDRHKVIDIQQLTSTSLLSCIQWALTKPSHRSRLEALLDEQNRRDWEKAR